jgi:uncharacterized protein YcfJ
MRNAFFKISLVVGAISFTSNAFAVNEEDGFYVWADVVDVTPIVSKRQESIPTSHCRRVNEHRRHRPDRRSEANALPALFGGVLGGVIGNQFGRGNGKRAMTVIGALAGASIATSRRHDISHEYTDSTRKVCRTSYETRHVDVVEGYRVTYEYMGREFEQVTGEHPGRQLKLYVTAVPVATNYI